MRHGLPAQILALMGIRKSTFSKAMLPVEMMIPESGLTLAQGYLPD
jgi:hypothetical protein